jgi:hypothetical protein
MQIIDGFRDAPHITSQQIADIRIGLVGEGDYILTTGEQFRYEIVSSNMIRIYDGVAVIQGRGAETPHGNVDELVIESGTPGATRKDLVVIRYTIDPASHMEDAQILLVKGSPNADDPVISDSTVVRDGAIVHDVALYRIRLIGITIAGVDKLFSVLDQPFTAGYAQSISALADKVAALELKERSIKRYTVDMGSLQNTATDIVPILVTKPHGIPDFDPRKIRSVNAISFAADVESSKVAWPIPWFAGGTKNTIGEAWVERINAASIYIRYRGEWAGWKIYAHIDYEVDAE